MFSPSVITMKLASSPSRNSSTTMRAPASPKRLPSSMSAAAVSAASSVCATITPLPAARPSALITIGAPVARMYSSAGASSLKLRYFAVGTRCRAMKSLVNALEPSSCAAAAVGPKQRRSASMKRSTRPATSGASGPTIVRSTFSRLAKASSASASSAAMATLLTPASRAVPAFPGATKTCETAGDCAHFQASACSLPPLPITRTFMAWCS